ncbi:aldo/keto reductase [Acidaminococcus sp. NSJ-142]|jgi:2,5-diketo-D-gluconate reductase A|uniref:aldo/keto reductase n=1 Tax=Acidaminococcus TaxID=904 RepID=UPI000E4D72A8|nr:MULTISPECIES: aldo/keto reductase [Acidaminococcus]MCD2436444.1 aldo/keto reductase [Acidaminococcus hominis]RHJ98542.1 aldo/keto reductase [Acidaminococcus sp. AM05-11]
MEYKVLANGVKLPMVGFGVFQVDEQVCEQAVLDALETGYRHIDTAATYLNEAAVGRAIASSGIKREDLFITTKLWVQDHGYENTKRAFAKSLQKLGLEYLDLYLIHKPYGDYYGAWRALEDLYKEGLIRAIGVTSFSSERLQDLFLHNEIKPMVNQIETNVWFQRKAEEAFLKKEGIAQEAWAPFAEGKNQVFQQPVLKAIGSKYNKTVGQVMLRWLLQRGVSVIPKTVKKERMRENLDVFDFALSDEDLRAIAALDTGKSTILDDQDLETAKWVGTVTYDL